MVQNPDSKAEQALPPKNTQRLPQGAPEPRVKSLADATITHKEVADLLVTASVGPKLAPRGMPKADDAPQPGAATFAIESPRLDEVRLWLDPVRFDFRLLGARQVLLPAMQARQLADNPTLARVAMEDASAPYALFNVRP